MILLEIFQYDFMVRAFIAGIVISIIAPLIGIFLVVRRFSMMGDTLAHVSLVGVAVGLATQTSPVLAAIVTSVLAAIGIERLRSRKNIFGESILAIFLSGSLAIAAVIVSAAKGFNVNFFSFLFGSISTVQPVDLIVIVGLGLIVMITLLLTYRHLFAISYDEDVARAAGIRVNLLGVTLVVLAAVTIALAMRIVGALLIGALMVIPVVTAMQFKRNFIQTTFIAVLLSLVSVVTGLFVSFYLDLASGGTIIVVTLIFFIFSLVLKR